jgi:hypothetical protein
MNTIQETNSAIRELTAHELDAVAGGQPNCQLTGYTETVKQVCTAAGSCSVTTTYTYTYKC